MKAPVDKASTARVLAGIADAVRPVERARTAAAVERVLRTACPGLVEPLSGAMVARSLREDMGVAEPADYFDCGAVEWCPVCQGTARQDVDELPGVRIYWDANEVPYRERRRYAPWVVSPHLFGGAS